MARLGRQVQSPLPRLVRAPASGQALAASRRLPPRTSAGRSSMGRRVAPRGDSTAVNGGSSPLVSISPAPRSMMRARTRPRPKRMTMYPKPTTTRRQFIATTTAAAAAFTIVPRHVLGGPRFVAPSDKVNVAIIGAGGQGRTNARVPLPGGGLPDHRARRSGRGVGPLAVVLQRQVGPRAGEGGD